MISKYIKYYIDSVVSKLWGIRFTLTYEERPSLLKLMDDISTTSCNELDIDIEEDDYTYHLTTRIKDFYSQITPWKAFTLDVVVSNEVIQFSISYEDGNLLCVEYGINDRTPTGPHEYMLAA